MKIVVAGAGKVGFELARFLSVDHEVTVIDKNAEALERLGELIDIYPLVGDIENPLTYRSLLDTDIDVFVAVTDSDEANILSTLLANDTIRIAHRIIRLRNSYFEQSGFLASLGDLERVFPFRLSAETVRPLLSYPGANNVKHFSGTDTKLISVQVDNPLHEEKQVRDFENDRLKIVGIERERLFRLPLPDERIGHGDLIYFLGDGDVLESLYGQLDLHMPPRIQTAAVFGAGVLGIEVAKVLVEEGVKVKIIEKEMDRCRAASDTFQDHVLVINSHYDEAILYQEERLDKVDMIITTDSHDETNIIRALQAQEYQIPKVIAINNERKYYSLMHQLGMVVVRGPRTSTYYTILESIARQATIETRHFCGGAGVVFARRIEEDSLLERKSLRPWHHEGSVLIAREGALFASESEMMIQPGDMIFLVTTQDEEKQGQAWMRSL
jgi:trk system potassium uptake protein TrkA